jgi:hypothetical protein
LSSAFARCAELPPVHRVALGAHLARQPRGALHAYAADEILHQYQRAARELWKFCWLGGAGAGVERTACACP